MKVGMKIMLKFVIIAFFIASGIAGFRDGRLRRKTERNEGEVKMMPSFTDAFIFSLAYKLLKEKTEKKQNEMKER